MRRLILLIILSCAGQRAWSEPLEWLTDARAAQEKAKRENKLVLLDFTGSDWCGWCMKLKSEVFDKPEFAQFANANLVLVEVDFPHRKAMAHLQQEANAQLDKTYRITGYPTIIVLNPDGRQVGRLGYVSGGPAAFIEKLTGLERTAKISAASAPTRPAPEPERPRKPVTFQPVPPAVPIHYGPLALKAISGTKERRMVLINNASMMAGETAKVRTQDQEVVVCCKEIREDSVLITCDGRPMELNLAHQ
jgi:thioredoxin-related protein